MDTKYVIRDSLNTGNMTFFTGFSIGPHGSISEGWSYDINKSQLFKFKFIARCYRFIKRLEGEVHSANYYSGNPIGDRVS